MLLSLTYPTELRKCLNAVFSQFGNVAQIHVSKAYKLRGQAWVVFDSAEAAAEAKLLMEGFRLYEKPLVRAPCRLALQPCACRGAARVVWLTPLLRAQRIEFAKTTSDLVAKQDGSFVPRPAYDKKQRITELKSACAAHSASASPLLTLLAPRSGDRPQAPREGGCCRRCAALHRVRPCA